MFQRWENLLFLHWRWKVEEIQRRLPPGLYVDTHEGEAFVGVVPFAMRDVHPRGLPSTPWISDFLELNLRTYVHTADGVPGVWFFSLDCNQPLAVEVARRAFALNYRHAAMQAEFTLRGAASYACRRKGQRTTARFSWRGDGPLREAPSGSWEYFVLERYHLFTSDRKGRIFRGTVHHRPYRFASATAEHTAEVTLAWENLHPSAAGFLPVLHAPGVEVSIWPLQPEVRPL